MKIILASASPRRRELMKFISAEHIAVSADCDETLPEGIAPEKASEYLAELKARTAAEKFPKDIVIGCDTTVIADGTILGKPADKGQCIDYMELLSGRAHKVITGCCIAYNSELRTFSEVTEVIFRKLSRDEIESYASTSEPYDKAGGYGIQGAGSDLIRNINGDFFNVVGLPVTRLYQELKNIL